MEYCILLFLPISERITLLVIPLSFLLPRSSLNLHFPQTRTSWTPISYIAPWNTAVSEFTFPFFQVLKLETWPWESRSATAGREALLGDICHQPPLSWNIRFLAASCTLNRQTNKKPSKNSPKAVWSRSEFVKTQYIFQPFVSIRKIRIKYHMNCALSSAQISLNCNVKNVRRQFWPV